MKYTKFITALCIAFALMLLGVAANAASIDAPTLDMGSTKVEITGQIQGATAYTNVTLEVFYPGKTQADLTYTPQNMLETLATYGQTFADKDGKYKFTFHIKGKLGDYLARVSTKDTATPYELTFFFATVADRENTVTQIKNVISDEASLKAILDIKNPNSLVVKTLNLVNPLIDTLEEDGVIKNIMSLSSETAIDPTRPSEFTNMVNQAIILQALNERKIPDVYSYRQLLNISSDFITTYELKIPASSKSIVSLNMSNKNITTLAMANSKFGESTLLTAVENGENWSVVDYIVKTHTAFLELNLADYNALKAPEKVDVALLGRSFGTKSAFKTEFLAEVAKQKQAEVVVISTPKSSGGGSSYSVKGQTAVLPLQELPIENKNKFEDIETVPWAKESIIALTVKGVLNGKNEKTFDPDGKVKREEFIKMIVLAFDFEDKASTASFDDVKNSDWFYTYIASGVKAKIVSGEGKGKFGVGNSITRQDMATILFRVAKLKDIKLDSSWTNKFSDHSLFASYALEGIYAMKNLGIIDGVGDNRFVPTDVCTRAQSAKAIYGLLEIIEKGGAVK